MKTIGKCTVMGCGWRRRKGNVRSKVARAAGRRGSSVSDALARADVVDLAFMGDVDRLAVFTVALRQLLGCEFLHVISSVQSIPGRRAAGPGRGDAGFHAAATASATTASNTGG
ncbi:MAG: hypothetical protein MUC46_04755 [Desulfobacterales bacterium]|nr:hypothetical protein [Desulfobacterales bacterium]